ncbi:MAG: phosphoribosylformylglycinamidine synthase subunit PurS [Bacteroidota bacterium]
MKYTAEIDVMPLKEILDPQGKAVAMGLRNLGIAGAGEVRVGRHITLSLEAGSESEALTQANEACRLLLANAITEQFTVSIHS